MFFIIMTFINVFNNHDYDSLISFHKKALSSRKRYNYDVSDGTRDES